MSSDSLLAVANLLLPKVLIEYFELTKHKIEGEEIHFYFTENNTTPIEFKNQKLTSKGFFPEATIQDFPLRSKQVFLHVTRRRWLNETKNKVVSRDWDLVAKGTRMTKEFATFLKISINNHPSSVNTIATFHGVKGKLLQRQYKDYLSEFSSWEQKPHADNWLLFPENMGKQLSIDETAFTNGELYTIVTNKKARGKKGALVAMVKGTKAENVIKVLFKIPTSKRNNVKEVTLDMAANMGLIVKRSFPLATRVIDRFHVQKLATEAIQEIRIKHRWEAIDKENDAIEYARNKGVLYVPKTLGNGDTLKQLLARSRYLLFKNPSKWTLNQSKRAEILFHMYPDLKKAYNLSQNLSWIFENTHDKTVGLSRMAKWYEKVRQSGFKSFNSIARTLSIHYKSILNYFDYRSTNASAESFNAKIKAFRAQFRGVRNISFFLFRLSNIFA